MAPKPCLVSPNLLQPQATNGCYSGAAIEHPNITPSSDSPLPPAPTSAKRIRSPTLNRIDAFSPANAWDEECSDEYDFRPSSPKRRTPRPSGENTPGRTPKRSTQSSFLAASKLKNITDAKIRPKKWTQEEDDSLRSAVKKHGARSWRSIAKMVPGRSHTQCLQHWSKVLKPGLVKGNWSKEEDAQLSHLVKSFAPEFTDANFEYLNSVSDFTLTTAAAHNADWTFISKHINGRTTKQCRERWFHHLDPALKHGPFEEDEDKLLLAEHAKVGSKWSLIASKIRGRTADAVKIRHITLTRLQAAGKPVRPPPGMSSSSHFRSPGHVGSTKIKQEPDLLNRVRTVPLDLPLDHPMHDVHMKSYHSHKQPSIQLAASLPNRRTDSPRPPGCTPPPCQEPCWIDELARRLKLPSGAKQMIKTKCDSLERDLQRKLQASEREKVARVISEACRSVTPSPPGKASPSPCVPDDFEFGAHADCTSSRDEYLDSAQGHSPQNLSQPPSQDTSNIPVQPLSKSSPQLPSLPSADQHIPQPGRSSSPVIRKPNGLRLQTFTNSKKTLGSLEPISLAPMSPLDLSLSDDGAICGLESILDLGTDSSFDAESLSLDMGDGPLLKELQILDSTGLHLSTDDPHDSTSSLELNAQPPQLKPGNKSSDNFKTIHSMMDLSEANELGGGTCPNKGRAVLDRRPMQNAVRAPHHTRAPTIDDWAEMLQAIRETSTQDVLEDQSISHMKGGAETKSLSSDMIAAQKDETLSLSDDEQEGSYGNDAGFMCV